MKTKKVNYTVDPREVYIREMRLVQSKMSQLREIFDEAVGDGVVPDNISWADVGAANRMRLILNEALEIKF